MILRCRPSWGVLLAVLSGAGPAHTQPVEPAAVDRVMQAALTRWAVPGAALVIVHDGKVIHVKGYGRRELGRPGPVTPDTVFPLASCSKAFTATALAMLVDGGQASWDDPVRTHRPDFHLADPGADALVTLRDLLTHRTGVGGHDLLWYRVPWDQDESIRRIGRMPSAGPFRATYAYSSIMYMVAGQAAGTHHPAGWAGLTRDRLLTPLGMTATTLTGPDAAKSADRAKGHRRSELGQVAVCDDYPMPVPNPAGSVHSTARDLGRWLSFQLGDGTWRGKRLLSATSLAEMHKPQTLIPLDGPAKALYPDTHLLAYAMGWTVQDYRGELLVQHGGWVDGFRVHMALLPERNSGLAILCNLHGTRMCLAASNTLIDLLLGRPGRDWNAYFGEVEQAAEKAKEDDQRRRDAGRRPAEKPTRPLADYVGSYEHPAYGTCRVTHDAGKLLWEWSSFKLELRPYRGDVFELRDPTLADPLATFSVAGTGVTKLRTLDMDFVRVK
jgi:CubicO group peptidase (beta-lactamase class C family)